MITRILFVLAAILLLTCTTLTLVNAQSVDSAPKVDSFSYECIEVRGNKALYRCTVHVPGYPTFQSVMHKERNNRFMSIVMDECKMYALTIYARTNRYRYELITDKCHSDPGAGR